MKYKNQAFIPYKIAVGQTNQQYKPYKNCKLQFGRKVYWQTFQMHKLLSQGMAMREKQSYYHVDSLSIPRKHHLNEPHPIELHQLHTSSIPLQPLTEKSRKKKIHTNIQSAHLQLNKKGFILTYFTSELSNNIEKKAAQ